MKLYAILTALAVLIAVSVSGCTGTADAPIATPTPTATPTATPQATAAALVPVIGETYLLVEYAGGWGGLWTNMDESAMIAGPGTKRIDIEKGRAIVATVTKYDTHDDPITVRLYVDGQLAATNTTATDTPISVVWRGI